MTGKMLGTGHDPRILHSLHVLYPELRHFLFALSKRTVVDDWIVRVVIDVHYRRIVDLDTDSPALRAHQAAILIDQGRVPGGPQHHLPGKTGDTVHPHAQAILRVDTKKDGCTGNALQVIDPGCLGQRPPLEETDATYIVFPDRLSHDGIIKDRPMGRRIDRREPDNH